MTPATTMQIRELICNNLKADGAQLIAKLAERNLSAKRSTVDTLRCDVNATIKALISTQTMLNYNYKANATPDASSAAKIADITAAQTAKDAKNAKRRANRAAKNTH